MPIVLSERFRAKVNMEKISARKTDEGLPRDTDVDILTRDAHTDSN